MANNVFQQSLSAQDGKIWSEAGQWKWFRANGNEAITIGEYMVFRTKIDIPKGSNIVAANFRTEYGVKDGNAVPQSFSANVFMEFNAAPYPETNDVYLGPVGHFPPQPRIRTNNGTTYTLNYTSNTPEADFVVIPIHTQLQEIVNRADYEPGQHVSVFINPTAEVGDISLRTVDNAFAAAHPQFNVEYIPPNNLTVTDRTDINWMGNHTFDVNTEGWGTHSAYGTFTDGTSLTSTTERSRRGGKAMKVAPTVTDATKGFMGYTNFAAPPNRSYVFCGWVYVPASNPNPFQAQFLYVTASPQITVKDQWVPFCTNVVNIGTGQQALWPAVVSNGSSNPAYHFFVDDLCVIESTFMQQPFDADSADHRRMEFKNLYSEQFPSVIRKSVANVQARVNPFIVLDDANNLAAFSSLTAGATIDAYNGGARVNIPSNAGTAHMKYTHTGHVRRKRYLVINSEAFNTSAAVVTKITTAQGGVFDYPVVQGTESAGSGVRRFYDIPKNAGDVNNIEFAIQSQVQTTSFVVYDVGESDRLTAQSNLVTSTGWIKDATTGLWKRTTTERQSATFDDAEAQSGHFVSSMTYLGFEQMGLTYNQWENQ